MRERAHPELNLRAQTFGTGMSTAIEHRHESFYGWRPSSD
jgi:hypothetical protein